MLATDWSPAADKATEFLMALKGLVEEINVIHVGREKALRSSSAMSVQSYRKTCRQRLRTVTDALVQAGLDARSHLSIGDPYQEIEKAARERRASMIVTGCSGKRTWHERIIGSVPRLLAEKSDLPTLIVPRQDGA